LLKINYPGRVWKYLDLVCFYFYKRAYGIDIESIKEIVEELPVTELFRTPTCLPGVTNLRGKILAVINFAELFNLPKNGDYPNKRKFIVISEKGGKEAALIVDDIIEVKWLEELAFQEAPDTIDNIIKTEKSPIPVIDVKKLLNDEIWKNINMV